MDDAYRAIEVISIVLVYCLLSIGIGRLLANRNIQRREDELHWQRWLDTEHEKLKMRKRGE